MPLRSPLSPAACAAALVLGLTLSACGGSDDAAVSTTTEAAADPASGDDATGGDAPADAGASGCPEDAAVSEALGAEVIVDPPVPERCGYYSADGAVSVGIDIEDPTTRTIEDIERNLPVDRIDGLGDAAYSAELDGGIVQLGVFADGRHVLVTLTGVDGADAETARAIYDLFEAA